MPTSYQFSTQDLEYLRHGATALKLRLYQPQGTGPFPAVIDLHGGAWGKGSLEECKARDEVLARSGLVVAALDFRDGNHGYPTALGIRIPPEKAGDFQYIAAENKRVIAEHHMTGHFATWPVPEVILSIRALTDLMVDSVEGKADYKNEADVKGHLQTLAGVPVTITKYDEAKGNSYLLLVDSVYY